MGRRLRNTTTIAVIGASGTAATRVAARLKARDVAVVEVSRTHGVDLLSGQGLLRALEGVDVVIDVSSPPPADRWSTIGDALARASRNVVGACAAQEIQRLVVSTIAGIEGPAFDGLPYYEAKRAAKDIVLDSHVPATIVKSTQWFEFATHSTAMGFDEDEVVVQDWLIPADCRRYRRRRARRGALGQTHAPRTITGPHPMRLPELTSRLLARQGDGRRVRAVQPANAAFAAGALLPPDQAIVVGPDAGAWLRTLTPESTDGRIRATSRNAPDYSKV